MTIKPIKSEDDYQSALKRLEEIFHAEEGSTEGDEAEIIGYKSRVSEILSRKRKLSLEMMRNLHDKLNISYESLMGRY